MADQIVLDLETQRAFDEVGGRGNLVDLGVSLVGTYLYENNQFIAYPEVEIPKLELLLSTSRRVIGFNIRRFDFPVLQPYCKNLKLSDLPMIDLLEEVEKVLGHRVSLDNLAKATLGKGKSGSGLDAIHYFRAGEWDKLKQYCLDDVRITRDLYEFGKKWGRLSFIERNGQTKDFPVQWQDPQPDANLSLF